MDSRAKLDELNRKLKIAYQNVKWASEEENNVWENFQTTKLENEAIIDTIASGNTNKSLRKEIARLNDEIEKSKKNYINARRNIRKFERIVEKLRKEISDICNQRNIAKCAGVENKYLDFIVVREDKINNAINIYFNDNPDTFGEKHGHYAIKIAGNELYYKRDYDEPKGPQNFLQSPIVLKRQISVA